MKQLGTPNTLMSASSPPIQFSPEEPRPDEGLGRWRRRGEHLRQHIRRGLPFLVGVLATLVGLFLYHYLAPPPEPLTSRDVDTLIADALASATPAPAQSALVYQLILPSLVFIQISDMAPSSGNLAQVPTHLIGQRAQPGGDSQQEPEATPVPVSIGSGVVINADGSILTALHVVDGAGYIGVTFADGTKATGTLVAAEPDNDIAVLQVDQLPEIFAPATLGNPNAMRIGDEAYVVGNPLGLAGSMSSGVISGFDRTVQPANLGFELSRLIQFDAAVNPGNSGGPLLNRNGEVVGIVVGLANPTSQLDFSGIGLAVRIDVAAGGAGGAPPQ